VAPPPSRVTEAGDPATPDGRTEPVPRAGDETESQPAPTGDDRRPLETTVAAAAALGLVGVVLLVLVLRRVRSFRHLRRGAPGAWAELLDALALAGHPADPAQPATAVADGADERFGTRGARQVADHAERTVFGPPTAGPDPLGGSATVRRPVQEVRRAARASIPLWRRWWWWLDPRVLLR